MISTEQWRQRIGGFCPRAQSPKSKHWRPSTLTPNLRFSLVIKLFVLTSVLMLAGDIEANPGPVHQDILKEIKAFRSENDKQLKIIRDDLNTFKLELQSIKTDINGIKDKLHRQRKDMDDIYDECYGLIKSLQTRVDQLENNNKTTHGSQIGLSNEVLEKLDTLEGFSRRNNLIFHGIPGSSATESSIDSERLLRQTLSKHLDLDVNSLLFDRVHRLNTSKTPQPIIARLTHFRDKQHLLRQKNKLKGTRIYINEDFTNKVRETRKKLLKFVTELRKKDNPPKANLVFDHIFIDGERFDYDPVRDAIKSTKRDHFLTLADVSQSPPHNISE